VRIYNLLVHGKLYEQIPVHERVLPIVEGVLDPGCLVSFLSSISIDPGERASAHAEDVQNLRDDELVPEGRRAGRRAGQRAGTREGQIPPCASYLPTVSEISLRRSSTRRSWSSRGARGDR